MNKVDRRLAAILALDVVGFSRMMGADEVGTLNRLKDVRAHIIDPIISYTNGRIVKLMGDGMLVEFDSSVNAVQCAIDIQEQLHKRNAGTPEEEVMQVRMGVNLGDVIIEGDDIYGDGVNVAARLESIADVGGIFVSASVQDSVQNKVKAVFEDIGDKHLKNIDHPVRVYRINIEGAVASVSGAARTSVPVWMLVAGLALIVGGAFLVWPSTSDRENNVPLAEKAKPLEIKSGKPIIAVLPFNNFSDDKDQEYFSDGLTEDLITDISKVSGLSVISRNSTFSYKGLSPDIRDVGKALGASHIVEGSVRKAGDTVRITVQLINATDGQHIWAERYDRELKDIFAIQDEVIGHIISALSIRLTPEEEARVANNGTENLEAYDLFMRGRKQEGFFTKASFVDAKSNYMQAIELDPDYANPYARLSLIHALNAQFGWVENSDEAYRESLRLAEKSVALDSSSPFAHYALGRTLSRPLFSAHDRAIKAFERSIELDPSFGDGYGFLSIEYSFSGDGIRGGEVIEKAMRVNPIFPFWYYYARGLAYFVKGDYDAAVQDLNTAAERNLTVFFVRWWLAASMAHAGQIDDANWEVEELSGMGFELTLDSIVEQTPIVDPDLEARFREGLQKSGF